MGTIVQALIVYVLIQVRFHYSHTSAHVVFGLQQLNSVGVICSMTAVRRKSDVLKCLDKRGNNRQQQQCAAKICGAKLA